MLIRDLHWDTISYRFSEEEKSILSAAVIGSALCPKAKIIDEAMLSPELREKLNNALGRKSKNTVT